MSAVNRLLPPPVSVVADINMPDDTVVTLDNGVVLHMLDAGSQELVRLTVMWDGGPRDVAMSAVPPIMTDALLEGAAGFTAEAIADAVDFNGARLGSRPGEHHYGLQLLSLGSRLPALLPMLRAILTEPQFEPRAVSNIARKAAAAMTAARARASYRPSQQLTSLLCGADHPASAEPAPEAVEAIGDAEVRRVYDATLRRGRLHVFLAGRLTPRVTDAVMSMLASLPGVSGVSPVSIIPYAPAPPCRVDIAADDAVQAAVAMGMPAIGRQHPDYIALRLAVIALGGYFSSRLMTNIREEKGLTYGISACLMGSQEGASVRISAQCDSRYVEQVIDETRAEMSRMVTEPVSGDELQRLRLHAFSTLASTTDSPFTMMDYYITAMEVGTGIDYFSRQLEAIASVTPARLASVAREYLDPDHLSVVTYG